MINKKLKSVQLQLHKTEALEELHLPAYKNIAVALDFSIRDRQLIAHAINQATPVTKIILIHIVESASAKVLGTESDDLETRKDQEKLDEYVVFLQDKGFSAESVLGFHNRQKEIARLVKQSRADLLIIGAHGHRGMKDWLYGQTIDAVRHQLKIPVLIVSL
jgi:manganese transport protein